MHTLLPSQFQIAIEDQFHQQPQALWDTYFINVYIENIWYSNKLYYFPHCNQYQIGLR